ncbi:Protein of unknown function [Bacillus cereus]|nr:Protein of unknown function [Bacillus cereus]
MEIERFEMNEFINL